jgi:hypothetical protein
VDGKVQGKGFGQEGRLDSVERAKEESSGFDNQNVKTRTALLVAARVGWVQRLKLGAKSRIAMVAIALWLWAGIGW